MAVNGRRLTTPAVTVTPRDTVTVDGRPLPARERPRLWRYHKPSGLVTTHSDEKGRQTVFDTLPKELGRVISVGRLDLTSEGLLLLTNDGELARALELPATGWTRHYRARAFGEVTQERLDTLKAGIEIEGVPTGPIEAVLEKQQRGNAWIGVTIREGRNREVRRALDGLGLKVNRLIRTSYGPFQLQGLGRGEVEEIKPRILKDQVGHLVEIDASPVRPTKSEQRKAAKTGAKPGRYGSGAASKGARQQGGKPKPGRPGKGKPTSSRRPARPKPGQAGYRGRFR